MELGFFHKKPDFVNEQGVKWWLDKSLTMYAVDKGLQVQVFLVEEPNGYKTRLIIENGEPVKNRGVDVPLITAPPYVG